MAEPFNPYLDWLGIAPQEQPPDYYHLLGVQRFEKRLEVIEAAAISRLEELKAHRTGPHAAACQKLANEITSARLCLTNENRRAVYDASLYKRLAGAAVGQVDAVRTRRVSAGEFLDILAEKDLVPQLTLAVLRGQVAALRTFTPAESVAKVLIEQGFLTRALADRLIETASGAKPSADAAKPTEQTTSGPNDELTLAPDEVAQNKTDLDRRQMKTPNSGKATAGKAPSRLPQVAEIPDVAAARLLEDPTLGGALDANMPSLILPRKKSWFSWMRLPKWEHSEDAWVVWLAILAVVATVIFLGLLIWTMMRPGETSHAPEDNALAPAVESPQEPASQPASK